MDGTEGSAYLFRIIDTLLAGVNTLIDSLTGLERILTTPVPFSYAVHLWTVTTVYVALLVSIDGGAYTVLPSN